MGWGLTVGVGEGAGQGRAAGKKAGQLQLNRSNKTVTRGGPWLDTFPKKICK